VTLAQEQALIDSAPEPFKQLGSRLADLLDADDWNNIEPLLLDLAAQMRSASGAWEIILKWMDDYTEEEATFSRYRDDVILDGIMTAAQMRALAALFPKQSRARR
jgi:glutathionylspermidine synthase